MFGNQTDFQIFLHNFKFEKRIMLIILCLHSNFKRHQNTNIVSYATGDKNQKNEKLNKFSEDNTILIYF